MCLYTKLVIFKHSHNIVVWGDGFSEEVDFLKFMILQSFMAQKWKHLKFLLTEKCREKTNTKCSSLA